MGFRVYLIWSNLNGLLARTKYKIVNTGKGCIFLARGDLVGKLLATVDVTKMNSLILNVCGI